MARNSVLLSIEADVKQALKALEGVEEGVVEITAATGRAESELKELGADSAQSLTRLSDAAESSSRAMQSATGQGLNYNNTLFQLGDAAQDAQFGLQGASNNLAVIAEDLSRAATRGESFTDIASGIGSAFLGAGGAVFAIQAALTVLPQLADALSSASGEMEDLAERAERLSEAVDRVAEFGVEVEGVEFGAADFGPAIREAETRLQGYQTALRGVRERLQELRAPETAFREGLTAGEVQARIKELEEERETLKGSVSDWEGYLQQLRDARQTLEDNLKAQRDLKSLLDETAEAARSAGQATADGLGQARAAIENVRAIQDIEFGDGQIPLPEGDGVRETADYLKDLNGVMAGVARSGAQVVQVLGEELPIESEAGAERVLSAFQQWRQELSASGALGVRIGQQISSSLTSGLADAIRGAKTLDQVFQGVLDTVLNVVSQLASTALIAAIISGPAGMSFGAAFSGLLGFEAGGRVGHFQGGGRISGPGGPRSDRVPILASNGEYVVNAASVAAAPGLIAAINEDPSFASSLSGLAGFQAGGGIGRMPSPRMPRRKGGKREVVRHVVEPRVLPSGDLSFAQRKAESNRARLGYT